MPSWAAWADGDPGCAQRSEDDGRGEAIEAGQAGGAGAVAVDPGARGDIQSRRDWWVSAVGVTGAPPPGVVGGAPAPGGMGLLAPGHGAESAPLVGADLGGSGVTAAAPPVVVCAAQSPPVARPVAALHGAAALARARRHAVGLRSRG
ncbi:MAG: hypothetical protein ACRDQ4_14120 [Pseudonocardiaceae bacterium]